MYTSWHSWIRKLSLSHTSKHDSKQQQTGFAPDLETSSMSLPSRTNSSLTSLDATNVTPGSIRTCRVNFSPRKLRMSTNVLFSETATLMGKWAYTDLILYRKPCRHTSQNANRLVIDRYYLLYKVLLNWHPFPCLLYDLQNRTVGDKWRRLLHTV